MAQHLTAELLEPVVLLLGGREAGARADRILITDDPGFVPTERPGEDVTPPDPVSGLTALGVAPTTTLSWTNPSEPGPLTVVVRYRTDGQFPVSPVDGLPLVEMSVTSGSASLYEHTGLINGTTYSYSVFVVDDAGNASDRMSVAAAATLEPPGTVQNLKRADTK